MNVSREEVEAMLNERIADLEKTYAEKFRALEMRITELEQGRKHAAVHFGRRLTELGN